MEHKALTINHRLESFVYVDAAARTGATGFASSDIGRIAYQTDTGEYWRLMSTTPTWQVIASKIYASYQGTVNSPSGTTTTGFPGVMAGVPGTITPNVTGKIVISISGAAFNDTAGGRGQVSLRYGTGTKPSNGDAVSGTSVGGLLSYGTGGISANYVIPVSLSAVVTGLTVGTPYWLDASINAVAAGTFSLSNVAILAVELP